jgi:PGF-pre-PGF domain-containing protein
MPAEDVKGSDSAIKRILADSNVEYDFPDGEGPVLGISFNAKDDKGTVVAKVQVLKDKPDDVDDPTGNSYQLMSITVGNEGTISDENADNILIKFKVSKEWIEENDIDPSTIRMTRFHDGEWQDLPSDSVGEDDEYFYFTAETPGFSVFSIVGDEYKEVIEEPIAEEPEGEEVADEPAAESAQTPGFTAMIAVALIASAALIMRKRL